MAISASSAVKVRGKFLANLSYRGRNYDDFNLSVLPRLCAELKTGLHFQSRHSRDVLHYGGTKPALSVCMWL